MKNLKLMFIVVLEIVIILESMFPFVLLDENQWLYMLTMIPQVLAALTGLSFAGYQFYGSKLQNMALRDKSLTDTVSEAENELYKRLKYIAVQIF